MKKYAEIIDKGECRSTLQSFFVNGVLANRTQWNRHEYYPQEGQVGELIESTPGNFLHEIDLGIIKSYTLVLKIKDEIYVPITEKGIIYISDNEFKMKIGNNSFSSGMNQNQKAINANYNIVQSGWNGMEMVPGAYYDAFWSDICQILKKHTRNFTVPMFHNELIHECLMYALDMCRHFERVSGLTLSNERKQYIASEVCAVFSKHFREFTPMDAESILNRVSSIDYFESLTPNIDNFYNQ